MKCSCEAVEATLHDLAGANPTWPNSGQRHDEVEEIAGERPNVAPLPASCWIRRRLSSRRNSFVATEESFKAI